MISIHSCPRTISKNYNPPQLNDSASSVANMANTAIYGIKIVLAQANRSIDYVVNQKILENPGFITSEDPEVTNSGKIEKAPFGTRTSRKTDPTRRARYQIADGLTGVERPHCQKKPAAKRQHVQPLFKHQQSSNSKNSNSSDTVTAQITGAEISSEASSNHKKFDRQDTGKPPSWRTPRYVQIGMVQTDEQPMGSEHKVIQYENSAKDRIFARDNLDPGAVPVSKGARKAPFETCGTWSGTFGP
ncbi:hypothetical protein AYI69_g1534 [Smittium culicis]|uniref:Uncharacterized protein n=1 Tax=Smittium culicis TaxID=133412 RepID=A0A1R1YQ59_9FUNG|nr:hypothetical protein AYI69_g1534 [Smittium culicis]